MTTLSCSAFVFTKSTAADAAAATLCASASFSSLATTTSLASRSCLFRQIGGLKLKLKLKWRTYGGEGGTGDTAAGDGDDDDDELCPVDCVREFKTDEELTRILGRAKETGTLVVVDFYRTSCGSCKYIEQGFARLCKGSGEQEGNVIFLKHNVIDEYDEQSEVAERLRIRAVPLFHFYKDGLLLEAFPTRDKERIVAAILKYTSVI